MIHSPHAAPPRKQRQHHNFLMGKPRFQHANQGAEVGVLHPWDLRASIPAWFPTSRLRDAHLTQFLQAKAGGREGACPAHIQVIGKSPWLEQKQHMDVTYPRRSSLAYPLLSNGTSSLPLLLLKLPIWPVFVSSFREFHSSSQEEQEQVFRCPSKENICLANIAKPFTTFRHLFSHAPIFSASKGKENNNK